MPELLEGISRMSSADRQTLLQCVVRAVAKADGPEIAWHGILHSFDKDPEQPVPQEWLDALDGDDNLPEGYVDADTFFDSVKTHLARLAGK